MSVAVHMPLRVRWPGNAPADSGPAADALAGALDRGLDRAMAQAIAEVFTPRGGYARPNPLAPSFVWQDSAGQVDGPMRALIENNITARIDAALVNRRLTDLGDAPEVLPRDPSEPVDWRRMRGRDYWLHSYDGDPDEEAVPADANRPPPPTTVPLNTWWHWDGTNAALLNKMVDQIYTFHFDARPDRSGMIFRGTKDGLNGMWYAHFNVTWSGEDFEIGRYQYSFLFPDFRVIKNGAETQQTEPPDDEYRHDKVGTYSGADQLRTMVQAPFLRTLHLGPEPAANETEEQSRTRTTALAVLDRFLAEVGSRPDQVLSRLETPLGNTYFLAQPATDFMGQSRWTLDGVFDTQMVPRSGDGDQGDGDGGGGEGEGGRGGEDRGRGGTRTGEGGQTRGEDGGGDSDGGQSGSPFGDPNAQTGEGRGSIYPRISIGGETLQLDLSPFLGEPNVNDIGELGAELKRRIRRIAYRLEMPEGEYCGAFLIAAAQVIGARASLAGVAAVTMPSATRMVEPGTGNMGDMEIIPEHTPAVQLLRFIGGTCPMVTDLTRLMGRVYWLSEIHSHYLGRYQGRPAGWMLHFHMAHTPLMKDSVGHLYKRACQAMMLQVLRSSAVEINNRLIHFDRYYPVFEGLINGFVADEAELRNLRDTLMRVQSLLNPSFQATVSVAVTDWRAARQLFSSAISDQILNASEMMDGPDLPQGEPFREADGTWAIRSANGRAWTMVELETAIAIRNGTASSIDPLINQLTNIPDVVDAVRNRPTMAKAYIYTLLLEMMQANKNVTADVIGRSDYAFRSGKIRDDLPNRTVAGTSIAMQGVHLMAHEAIGDAFGGNNWYGIALNYAFNVELGMLGLITFFETGLVLTLSVLCPPAGAALGLAFAAVHYDVAVGRMEIARAVMNPDELFDRAELELDLFMAQLEIALSIIPELGSIGRGVTRGANVIGQRGVRRGVARLSVEARRQLIRSFARQARAGLAGKFMAALITDRAMALILPQMLGPFIAAVDAELRMVTVRPAAPSTPAGPVAPASSERPSSPEGAAFHARLDEYDPLGDEETRTPLEDQP